MTRFKNRYIEVDNKNNTKDLANLIIEHTKGER